MKYSFLWVGCLAASLSLIACGSDSDSGTESNIDFDEELSSSSEESSSSVESSAEETLANGMIPAKLEDLPRYLVLDLNGEDVYMASGMKAGMFSFWSLNKDQQSVGRVLALSDFAKGVISTDASNSVLVSTDALAEKSVLHTMAEKKMSIQFAMKEDTLFYAVDGSEKYNAAKVESYPVDESVVTNAEKLDGKRLACTSKDTTTVYSFYKGRYTMERVVGKDTVSWNAGYADIHRGKLLMKMEFRTGTDYPWWTKTVKSDMKAMDDVPCSVKDFKYSAVEAESVVGAWSAMDKEASINWTFDLKDSKSYELSAAAKSKEQKIGSWDVYGDVLLLGISSLMNGETRDAVQAIKGNLVDVKEDGFTFNHSYTPDADYPKMPKAWTPTKFE